MGEWVGRIGLLNWWELNGGLDEWTEYTFNCQRAVPTFSAVGWIAGYAGVPSGVRLPHHMDDQRAVVVDDDVGVCLWGQPLPVLSPKHLYDETNGIRAITSMKHA